MSWEIGTQHVSRFGCGMYAQYFYTLENFPFAIAIKAWTTKKFQKAIEQYHKIERMPLARHRLVRAIHLGHLSNSLFEIIGMDSKWLKNIILLVSNSLANHGD